MNGLVRRHFKLLKKDRPFIAHVQEWITIFLSWWVVPITMIAFWLRFFPRHDWWGTCFHIGIILICISFAIIFYRLCSLTLQGKEFSRFILKENLKYRMFYCGVIIIVFGIIFSLLSYGAIEGVKTESYSFTEVKKFVPMFFKNFGYDVFADFSEMDVSKKPENYWSLTDENKLKSVNGANLRGRNLRNANMKRAFLVQADLRESDLYKSELHFANLEQANFDQANLQLSNFLQCHTPILQLL